MEAARLTLTPETRYRMQTTFPRLLLKHAAERPAAPAVREKEYGIWQAHSWVGMAALVEHIACGLHQAGLQRGEHMVIIGATRPRLYATMLAAQSLGAIAVPLYQDEVDTECVFHITNAEVRFAMVEDQEQVDKLLEIRDQCPQLSNIIFDNPKGLRKYLEPGLVALDALIASGHAFAGEQPGFFRDQVEKTQPDDVAAMFFTSGTTGNPKGVVHTHNSLLDRAQAGAEFDKLTNTEEVLAYLPPAWIGQNIFSYAQWLCCGYVVNCPESASTVAIDLKEVGPTYYFAPPRVFEGLQTSVMIRMEATGAIMRGMFHFFINVAKRVGPALMNSQSVGAGDRLLYALGQLMVYGPLRNNLGLSRVRVAYVVGDAIGSDLFTFYRSIGVNLKQLYGSTETAVLVCMQPDNEARADTVGMPIRGVQIKVADNGEILVKSGGLLKGYYKNPGATAEVLTADGWYHTGDIGFLDASGHLKIIDRVEDVGRMKGSANDGVMFAPKYVENKLKFFSYVKEVVAYGDGREKVCVMINIDFDAVGNWAAQRKLPYVGYTDLAQKPEVHQLIKACVEKVNADLSADTLLAGSQISRFLVLHKELDVDDSELTRTNKIRRGFIADKYQPLIDAMYGDKTEQFIETVVKFEDGLNGSISATLVINDSKTFDALKAAA